MYKLILVLACGLLLVLRSQGLAGTRVISKAEYPIDSKITSINLSGYNGAIRWVPMDSSAKGRVVVEKIARGSLRIALDKFLGEIEVENLSSASQLVLKANKPRRIWGVSTSEVRFTVYASPDQIQEFQAQTSNGAIKVDADFFGLLNLKTSNGSITLHSAAGGVNIQTSNGAIHLGKLHFTESSSVKTSNGRIEGIVSFSQSGNFLFANSNGNIDLRMPANTQGSFDISTSNGTVDFQLGENIVTGQRKVLIMRDQGLTIRIKTSNGKVSVGES